jgi:EpsI family protein
MTAPGAFALAIERRQFLFGAGMLMTAVISHLAVPHAGKPILGPAGLDPIIPKQFSSWHSIESPGFVLPPADETEVRVYDQILTRTYAGDGGNPMMLLIAFGGGQTGLLEIHRPEACYPSQGYSISNRHKVELQTARTLVPAVTCTATSDIRTEQLLYWTRIGEAFPRSWAESQMATIESNLKGFLPDGILVRISTISSDVEGSMERLRRFASALADSTEGVAHKIMFGVR